jgi:hypothetical protein
MTAAPELYGLTVAEAAERTAELAAEQATLLPLIDRMGNITGTAAMATNEFTVNQDALNKSLFEAVQAGESNTKQIVAMGLATGQLNQQQADAIIQAAFLFDAQTKITEAFLDNTLSAEDAAAALVGVADGTFKTAEQAIEAYKRVTRTHSPYH